jgi:hypothetical protein
VLFLHVSKRLLEELDDVLIVERVENETAGATGTHQSHTPQ